MWKATPAQRAAWRNLWAACHPVLFAPARLPNGELQWIEIEEGTQVWALCELAPPGGIRSLVEAAEPIGMRDYLIPLWWFSTELSLDEFAAYCLGWIKASDGSQ